MKTAAELNTLIGELCEVGRDIEKYKGDGPYVYSAETYHRIKAWVAWFDYAACELNSLHAHLEKEEQAQRTHRDIFDPE
jgi:hypothetical protein